MAVYVTSDIHGHARAFDRALEMVQPGEHDAVFILGDLVDRGPDSLAAVDIARSLPNAYVLLGNHEALMLGAVLGGDERDEMTWHINGGYVTSQQLDAMSGDARADLLDWMGALPTFAVASTDDLRPSAGAGERRVHLLCHAGIDAAQLRSDLAHAGVALDAHGGYGSASVDELLDAMAQQGAEDLLWTRGTFWSAPTGLVGADGRGPVVVAGHTPSLLLGRYASLMCGPVADEEGRALMVEVGATADTGGVPDRLCIDCSAAAGHPSGCVGIMRLEDRRVWRVPIEEGE